LHGLGSACRSTNPVSVKQTDKIQKLTTCLGIQDLKIYQNASVAGPGLYAIVCKGSFCGLNPGQHSLKARLRGIDIGLNSVGEERLEMVWLEKYGEQEMKMKT
jgi:hypothetical protein